MARKKYMCDFETTTDPNDCRVWAYGWMEIGNTNNYYIGNNIEDFMIFCKKSQADLYFHNLRFDGEFIVNWLLKNGWEYNEAGHAKTFKTIISSMGQWYGIDISYGFKGKRKLHTVIYDSLKKLPFPIAKIAKDFNLPILKGEIDYHKYRPIGHEVTEEEREYIHGDLFIGASALKIQFDQGLTKITNGSDSLNGFKTSITKKLFDVHFPVLDLDMDKNIRLAYRGGFTWLNEKYAGKELGNVIVYDVNSLYPSQMYDKNLPYGVPLPITGEYQYDEDYPLFVQHIRCMFELKDNHIPTIQIKKNMRFRQNEYLKSSDGEIVDLYVSNVDWELIKEHYHVYDVQYLNGFKFKSKSGLFKKFIDKWNYIKTHSDGAIQTLAKLMLNALYGKFATNPDVTGKIPFLKEDGSCGFRLGDEEFRDPVYTAMGIFVTSYARDLTIRTAQKCYDRIIYCDTDSIHLIGDETPETIADLIDDKKMGYWAYEGTFQRAKYLRQKTYIHEYTKDGEVKLIVKCAGMPDKVKENVTFDNFVVGFSSWGKLMPKHVSGGVVLVDGEFTIK